MSLTLDFPKSEIAPPKRGALPITGLIITKNEADRIERCLASLSPLCAELIVVDSGSTDGTQALARQAGATVIEQPWLGFDAQKNFALEQASQPWVLFLDADEWLTAALAERIRKLFDVPYGTLSDSISGVAPVEQYDAYWVHFRTLFLGRELRRGEPGNEKILRLMRRSLRYKSMRVHEALDVAGNRIGGIMKTDAVMMHDTCRSLADYRAKLMRYADLSAQDKFEQGKRASWLDLWLRPLVYLTKNYLFRLGFLDGIDGYIYHRLLADYVFSKYARLRELERLSNPRL